MKRYALAASAVAALIILTGAAVHGMQVNVWVDSGADITGEAHYHSVPVVDAEVLVLAPDGKTLGELRTDAEGGFSFTASYRCNHRFVVRDGGHKGEDEVPAEDLPDSLPPYKP